MSQVEGKEVEHGKAVLAAAVQQEKRLQAATIAGTDEHDGYVKSSGGTKKDTQVKVLGANPLYVLMNQDRRVLVCEM